MRSLEFWISAVFLIWLVIFVMAYVVTRSFVVAGFTAGAFAAVCAVIGLIAMFCSAADAFTTGFFSFISASFAVLSGFSALCGYLFNNAHPQ